MLRQRKLSPILLIIIGVGLVLPQKFSMPVQGGTKSDFNPKSFWYYPWGKSGTHKGVDIFASLGTNVRSSTSGLVIYSGQIGRGGKVVLILGSKWRIHYFAHLDEIKTSAFSWANRNEIIGSIGTTGNAAGKSPHLHYSIVTLIPYVWRIDCDKQGWKKMFFLNPIDYLKTN
ncbi:M23 family metallopeptidase [Xanthovirga aplysinae]|uniref:M23 family metallopeptidase n=1 Tax=Xanthovirga aplysinae TaxID=2529853 RepID=UPI0012BD3BE1|nr:M23 family metallopeptidase [Xanthovirga aplysinae]MTI32001.1 M23 family metallopeptidase [Xanthovirga aplysinae]